MRMTHEWLSFLLPLPRRIRTDFPRTSAASSSSVQQSYLHVPRPPPGPNMSEHNRARQVPDAPKVHIATTSQAAIAQLGPDHPDTLRAKIGLANHLSHFTGKQDEAKLILEAIEAQHGGSHTLSLHNQLIVRYELSMLYGGERAIAILQADRKRAIDGFGELNTTVVAYDVMLGNLYTAAERYEEAAETQRAVLQYARSREGPLNLSVALNNLGGTLSKADKYEDALPYLNEALVLGRDVLARWRPKNWKYTHAPCPLRQRNRRRLARRGALPRSTGDLRARLRARCTALCDGPSTASHPPSRHR